MHGDWYILEKDVPLLLKRPAFEKSTTLTQSAGVLKPSHNKTYAAPEPCRRQRPERSEDAAREQAAEGRMAKRFRPGKKTDETASDMTRDLNC